MKENAEKTYDGLDRVTSESYGTNGIITKNYTYVSNIDGSTTNLLSSESFSNGSTFSYTYDAMGRLTTVSENGILRIRYTYDSLGQVVREDNAFANLSYTCGEL